MVCGVVSVDLTHAQLRNHCSLCPWGSFLRQESQSTAAGLEQEVMVRTFCRGTAKG